MKLTKKSETGGKITFTYDKPAGAVEGYVYFADGNRVSKTMNPNDLEVTFSKVPSGKYAVEAVGFDAIARAEWPEVIVEPEPTPPGTVYFRGNFETGNFKQWLYVAAINTGYPDTPEDIHGYAYITPPGPVGSGTYAARFDLPAGTRKQRVDAVTPEYNFSIGQDLYFSHEFYLPANWSKPIPFPNQFYTIGQYLAQQPGITANHTMMLSQANLRYVIQSGYINQAFGGAQYNNGGSPTGGVPITYAIPDPLMIKEVWHQMIIRIRAATNMTGIVQVWWRKRPDTAWTQTVNLTGFPTLAWTSSGTPNPSLTGCKDFLNCYRGTATTPSTIYHDNFCRASTFAAAESCFG